MRQQEGLSHRGGQYNVGKPRVDTRRCKAETLITGKSSVLKLYNVIGDKRVSWAKSSKRMYDLRRYRVSGVLHRPVSYTEKTSKII